MDQREPGKSCGAAGLAIGGVDRSLIRVLLGLIKALMNKNVLTQDEVHAMLDHVEREFPANISEDELAGC